ncbi:MAG: NADH-quinone oxidoreductase subunit B family protein [Ignisphaera sp.]
MDITTISSFSKEDLEKALKRIKRSIWVYHINTGGCNGCDIEILDVLTPWFDVERFGIKLVASPRHADLALVTGPITIKTLPRVVKALRAMPRPRLVLAIGSCAVGGNIWFESYSTIGGFYKILDKLHELGVEIDKIVYVPGCPARPEAIIYGVALLLGLVKQKVHYVRKKA